MRLKPYGGLVVVTAEMTHDGATVEIPNALIDTGAESTIINADLAADAGIFASGGGYVRQLFGVGGTEPVFSRHIDRLAIGGHGLVNFEIEIGAMDYGLDFGGIIGLDFLRRTGAVLDLRALTIELE